MQNPSIMRLTVYTHISKANNKMRIPSYVSDEKVLITTQRFCKSKIKGKLIFVSKTVKKLEFKETRNIKNGKNMLIPINLKHLKDQIS